MENGVQNHQGENGVQNRQREAGAGTDRSSLLTLDQKNSSSDLFISISGLIGAGKSTLATKLAEKMNLPCFYEPVIDNTYLADFYRDPARYSFPLQVRHFLSSLFLFIFSVIFFRCTSSIEDSSSTNRSSGRDEEASRTEPSTKTLSLPRWAC